MRTFLVIAILGVIVQRPIAQIQWEEVLNTHDAILLGEAAHGVESFYALKRDAIRQIAAHSERKVLVLVESPLVLSVVRSLQQGTSDYHYHHTNTEPNIGFFDGFVNFGIDLQEDCRFREFSALLVQRGYCAADDRDVVRMDSLLSRCILGEGYVGEVLSEESTEALKLAIRHVASKVLPQVHDEGERMLLELCFKNRQSLADYLNMGINDRYRERIRFRDHAMAENAKHFIFRREEMPIVWAANLHIGKQGVMGKKWTNDEVRSMAEHLEKDLPIYRIAIDSRTRREHRYLYDATIIAEERKRVPEKYLVPDCGK